MWKPRLRRLPFFFFFLFCLLLVATQATEQNESWTCLCGSTGLVGTQFYTGDEKLGFTECGCSTAPAGCRACPIGQLLSPFSIDLNDTMCSCTNPLFVIIQLVQLRLKDYTQSTEATFRDNLAFSLNLSASQIFFAARRNGSVTLDTYIFPHSQKHESLTTARNLLLQGYNNTVDAGLWDSRVGPWKVLYLASMPMDADGNGINLLLQVLVACAAIGVVLLLISSMFLVYKRVWNPGCPTNLGHQEGNSTDSNSKVLLSQQFKNLDMFHVYNNTCFTGTGKRSFKLDPKIGSVLGIVARRFSYLESQEATGGFKKSNVIGIGGSSIVYAGFLKDGRKVAIKKLDKESLSCLEREFLQEVELLTRLHHFHLVPLFGYCIEAHGTELERLLVYEYMANGNLREHLNQPSKKQNLDWVARLKIALGAARGLEYLHEAANPRVIHRDFKSSNILLDMNWRAKVADFGMATVVKEIDLNTCLNSPAQMLGTFGYFAPEYAMMGRATVKSDVFSFGVVLLELMSGRRPIERKVPVGQASLVIWALPLLRDDSRILDELIDPTLRKCLPVDDAIKMAHLAWLCLQMDAESRPTMTFVVQVLATMIPENCAPISDYEHLMLVRDKLSSGYSFSRQDQTLSSLQLDGHIDNNQEFESRHMLKWEPAKKAFTSTSVSAAEYPEKFNALPSRDMVRKPSDEETDLVKPRLQYFWQNNGILVQERSPTR